MLKIILWIIASFFTAFLLLILFASIIYTRYKIIDGKKIDKQLKKLNNLAVNQYNDFKILNPYRDGGNYLKAQLHTHTTNSDGSIPPDRLVKLYKEAGFKFLAITDHDRITNYTADSEITLISGEEMTHRNPFWPYGEHMGRLFVNQHINEKSLQNCIDKTVQDGGFAVINHPSCINNLGTQQWLASDLTKLNNYFLIEFVNHYSSTEKNLLYWHGLLKYFGANRPIWGIAGDDTHAEVSINKDYIRAGVTNTSINSLKDALKKGNFYVTNGPVVQFGCKDKHIFARAKSNMNIKFVDADFNTLKNSDGNSVDYKPVGNEGFIRVEVTDLNSDQKAWSQPFWLKDNI